MQVYEYITAPTETVHLVRQVYPYGSLCGMPTEGWSMGDETLSGVSATCQRCIASVRKDQA
jgi:hypothetical protein